MKAWRLAHILVIATGLFFGYGAQVYAATPDLTASSVTPSATTAGVATTLVATITNSGSAATGSSFPVLFEINATNNPASFAAIAVKIAVTNAALAASGAHNTINATYATSSAGTYYVRACANTDTGNNNAIAESNTTNNCGAWVAVTVSAAPTSYSYSSSSGSTFTMVNGISISMNSSYSSVYNGQVVAITWSGTGATTCTGTNFSTGSGSPVSGTVNLTPSVSTTYTTTCAKTGGSASTYLTVNVYPMPPVVTLTASPPVVGGGGSSTLTWASTNSVSCSNTFNSSTAVSGSAAVTPTGSQTYTVTCFNSSGDSTLSNVTVVAGPPAAPTGLSGSSSADGLTSSLSWSGPGATSYAVMMSPFATCPIGWTANGSGGCTTTSVGASIAGIATASCTGYTWSVIAINGSGNSPSTASSFISACPVDLTAGNVTYSTVSINNPATFSAVVSNSGVAATAGSFPVLFEINPGSIPGSFAAIATNVQTSITSSLGAGGNTTASVSYTPTATGTYYVRACANTDSTNSNTLAESNYTNNCSASWTSVSVCSLNAGTVCTTPANDCGIHNAGTYQCDGSCYNAAVGTINTAVAPPDTICDPAIQTLITSPSRVKSGGSGTVTWSASFVTRCTLSGYGISSPQPVSSDNNGNISTQNFSTPALVGKADYTLNCAGNGGKNTSQTTTIGVFPIYREY